MAKIILEHQTPPSAPSSSKSAFFINPDGLPSKVDPNGIVTTLLLAATVDISSEEILALSSEPKELVAAPGDGKLIVPIAALIAFHYGGVAYETNTILKFQQGNWISTNYDLLGEGIDSLQIVTLGASTDFGSSSVETSDEENIPLTIFVTGGDPINGNGTLRITVIYTIIDLP